MIRINAIEKKLANVLIPSYRTAMLEAARSFVLGTHVLKSYSHVLKQGLIKHVVLLG